MWLLVIGLVGGLVIGYLLLDLLLDTITFSRQILLRMAEEGMAY